MAAAMQQQRVMTQQRASPACSSTHLPVPRVLLPRRQAAGGRRSIAVRSASEDADADLDKRLEKLRLAKGATPYGQGTKAAAVRGAEEVVEKPKKVAEVKPAYDWTGETVYYEGPPHRGDLVLNLALGASLVWLPLTFAAIGRGAFMNYKFTDRRLSISTNAPWKTDQTDIAYQEVKDVVTVGRGIGLWGDMVVTLKDNSKIEVRSLDRFLELKAYVLQRRDELSSTSKDLTAAELMGEPAAAGRKKGFA